MNHAIAERLRHEHGLTVTVTALEGALRRYDAAARSLVLSETLPRESRGFHMAFQLALLEARSGRNAGADTAPSSAEAAMLIRIGLLNYCAGALLMPYERVPVRRRDRFGTTWKRSAPGSACRSNRRATGCRLCSGQARGACRFSSCGWIRRATYRSASPAAGYPFARYGGSCPKWIVHNAFARPGRCMFRSRNCRTARRICVSRAP